MSFRGNLLRAGIDSDGKVVTIYRNDGRLDILTAASKTTGTIRSCVLTHTEGANSMTRINETLRVTYESEYYTGDWVNAIVGRIDYGDAGDARGGMAAAICAEMNMPAKSYASIGGPCYSLDCEFNCPTDFVAGDRVVYPIAFIKFGSWGGAKTQFDTEGYLFHTEGLTAGSGGLLSENSRTLRVNIEGADKFIYLSDTEDDLGTMVVDTITVNMAGADGIILAGTASDCGIEIDGATADGIRIDGTCSDSGIEILGVCTDDGILIDYTLPSAAARAFYIDVDSAVSGSNIQGAQITLTNTAAANNARAMQSNLVMGSNCAGPYGGYFTTDMAAYQATGLAAALGMELILPSAAITSGEFHGMTIDIACTENSGIGAGKHSFIKVETWGNATAMTAWDTGANLLFINGPTAGAGKLISADSNTIRINIAGTSYYLPLSATENVFDFDKTSTETSGDLNVVDIDLVVGAAGTVNDRALTVDLAMGASCAGPYAGYFRVDCVGEQVLGLGAALGMELCLPGATLSSGEFHGMTIDIECAESFSTGAGGKHSFIKVETWGNATAKQVFDDAFNLFFINGPASGAGNLISANNQTLRVNLNATLRYMVLSQAEDILSFDMTTTGVSAVPGMNFDWSSGTTYGAGGDPILGDNTVEGFLQIGDDTTPCEYTGLGSKVGLYFNANVAVADLATHTLMGGIVSRVTVEKNQATANATICGITSYIRNEGDEATRVIKAQEFAIRGVIYTASDDEAERQCAIHAAIIDRSEAHANAHSQVGIEVTMQIHTSNAGVGVGMLFDSQESTYLRNTAIFDVQDDNWANLFRFRADGSCGGYPAIADETDISGYGKLGAIKVEIDGVDGLICVYKTS